MDALNRALPWKVCITIRSTPHRRRNAEKELAKIGWTVPFLEVDRDDDDPQEGCYDSHVKAMRLALAAGVPYALVLEDDVMFRPHAAAEREVVRFLQSGAAFDALLLGHCTAGHRSAWCKTFKAVPGYTHLSTSDCLCLHAVVYSREYMESFVRDHADYIDIAIDDILVELGKTIVIVRPNIAVQNKALPSTIEDEPEPSDSMLCAASALAGVFLFWKRGT